MVGEYNAVVDTWNSGPGADGSFQELEIHAKLTTNRQTQLGLTKEEVTVLLGKVAPEDIGDSSQKITKNNSTMCPVRLQLPLANPPDPLGQ